MRPRQLTSAELHLKRENDGLRTTIVCLRRELANKNQYTDKLEYLLHERMNRIDELNAKLAS